MERETMMLSYARLQWLLLAFCGILLALLIYEMFAPIPEWNPPAIPHEAYRFQAIATYPFIAPSTDAFDVIDARPVFNPRRTPLQVTHDASDTGSGSVMVSDLSLVGIILDRGTRIALLRVPSKPLAVAVTTGTSIDAWQVVSIGSDRIVLRADGSDHELLLSANKPAAQPNVSPARFGQPQPGQPQPGQPQFGQPQPGQPQ
jgi:hypothetical protein